MNEGFLFRRYYYEAIQRLPKEERLKAYENILNYAFYGKEPEDDSGIASIVFIMVRDQIDADMGRER
jgi:hypothetical protein